ncbi:hypothetical protein MKX03_003787 [Papaver bracteatum]|nr:hypothetical protein MKX03_003787 [Papaver bracteatum]
MADALVSFLIKELGSLIKQEIEQEVRLVVGVEKEVTKLESTFMNLQAVLNDAEQRQMEEESVKFWLAKLKNAAYEMEDILDEWGTKIQRSRLEKLQQDEDRRIRNRHQVTKLSSYFCSPFSCVKKVALQHDIASKIKQILETLEFIKNERDQFKFNVSDQRSREGSPYTHGRKETSSTLIDRQDIVGRDFDRDIIVNRLLDVESSTNHMENDTKDLRVISIIGMGGLGKTTLAQLVFDHDKVKSHFKLLMWVCVSDPFDRTKVANAIVREATGEDTHTSTWNALFQELCQSVKGKKFLLVLDDVWTNDPNNLKDLMYLLDLGDHGSRFLVTTRSESVASALNSHKHILQGLNFDQSSSLLFRKAFHGKEKLRSEVLEDIGTQISTKCHGLPLALSLLGSLLNKKINENHWTHVLKSKIWELKGFDHQKKLVYPIFLLSYDGLESQLKNCFLYCATFPKACYIRKRTVVRLWMAQGFLNSSDEAKDPELTGEEYFDELADRAFFQDFSINSVGSGVCCKMHDLVHDFAQFLTKDHCYDSYNNGDTFSFNRNRNPIHLSLIYDDVGNSYMGPKTFHDSIRRTNNVRTVQCRQSYKFKGGKYFLDRQYCSGDDDYLSSDLVHHLRNLRVLKLKGMGIAHIPNEIAKLIHLRYLDLSRNENLYKLPDSICGLINLQTLKLKRCKKLIRLPKDMGRMMIKLRNLDIRHTGLVYLPKGIRNWKSLQTLSTFIVDALAEGCKIEELKHHNLLKDCLEIKGLRSLESAEQAAEAKLQTKSQLTELGLDFESQLHQQSSADATIMESVLWVLQPHSNLKKLTINNYLGSKFPSWMGDRKALRNLGFLELYKCFSCTELPALGLLPFLEVLVIKDLRNLKRIGVEIYDGSQCVTEVAFPKLITLEISETANLEVWEFGNGEVQVGEMMPCVTSIKLTGCKNLIALPALSKLQSLETLHIQNAHQLTRISCQFYYVEASRGGIRQCNRFTSFPKLATLDLSFLGKLEVIVVGVITEGEKGNTNNGTAVMPCLKSLRIRECRDLKSFGYLTESLPPSSLENLHLCNLNEFGFGEEEADNLSLLPCLLDLDLWECPKLITFPRHLPSLSCLRIDDCPLLISKDFGPYLPMSANLTEISIYESNQSLFHLENLARFKELRSLVLCAKLDESFKFIPVCLQNLTKLEYLWIKDRSGMYQGGNWSVLSHISDIRINNKKIDPLTYSALSDQISILHQG